MADPKYVISSPKLSFFQIANSFIGEGCIDGHNICWPILNNDDLAFQFQITAINASIAQQIFDSPVENFELLLVSIDGATEIYNFTTTDNLYFKKFRTGVNEITYVWDNQMDEIQSRLEIGKCFRFKTHIEVSIDGAVEETNPVSNCFYLTDDGCYTTRLAYRCDEDGYGFRYCNTDGFTNVARIPMHLTKPQFVDEQTVYVKSDGSYIILRSVTRQEFTGETELLAKEYHEKITMALNHDFVNVSGANYSGGARKNGGYTIDWDQNFPNEPAQASFKVNSTPYNQRNNNCANCKPVVVPGLCGTITELTADIEEGVEVYRAFITGVTYYEPVIANQVLAIFYREAGVGGYTSWGAITCNPAGDVIGCESPALAPGYHAQDHLEITEIPPFWEQVEIKAVMLCSEEEYSQNFDRVGNPCPPLHGIVVSEIATTTADVNFTSPRFLPPGGFNWELRKESDDIVVNFGTAPGTHISLVGMTSGITYYISIISNCQDGDFSEAVDSAPFTTL